MITWYFWKFSWQHILCHKFRTLMSSLVPKLHSGHQKATSVLQNIIDAWICLWRVSSLLNEHRTECKLLYVEQLHGQLRVLCCFIHTKKMKIHIYRKVFKQKFKYCIYSKSPQSSQMTNFLISFTQTWQTWGFSPVWVLDILIVPSS